MASLININKICCGTCEHWSGKRDIVEFGRRIKCESGLFTCPWRKSGSTAIAIPACPSKQYYKRAIMLP